MEPWPALARALARHSIPKEAAYGFIGVTPKGLQRMTNPLRRRLYVERIGRVTRDLDAVEPSQAYFMRAIALITGSVDPDLGIPALDDPI